jgi:hypothetical protein
LSYSIAGNDTNFMVQQIRNDVVKLTNRYPRDTTYTVQDTTLSAILVSSDNIKITWPFFYGSQQYTIPRKTMLSTDVYSTGDSTVYGSDAYLGYSSYNINGPYSYYRHMIYSSHAYYFIEQYTLQEFSKQ